MAVLPMLEVPLTQAKFWISKEGSFLGSAAMVWKVTVVELAEVAPIWVSTPLTQTSKSEPAGNPAMTVETWLVVTELTTPLSCTE